jgi:hypothetical protein
MENKNVGKVFFLMENKNKKCVQYYHLHEIYNIHKIQ